MLPNASGFAAVIALTFYVVLDIEYPRLGFVRIDAIEPTARQRPRVDEVKEMRASARAWLRRERARAR